MTITTRRISDKAHILAYLETDRVYAAYAIGDLDEGFFESCTWHVAERDGQPCALALVYIGLELPVLFLMGTGEGVAALLGNSLHLGLACPMAREEHLAALGQHYRWSTDNLWPMWRMALRPADFRPAPASALQPRRLDEGDVDRLNDLYALGGGDAFTVGQLAQGIFYGIEQAGQLIATAGTHLVSQAYSIAAVGNVMTHPSQRGRGYATLATGAVCTELIRRGIATIVLNAGQDNAPAVRAYQKLGFVQHCTFYEGLIERR